MKQPIFLIALLGACVSLGGFRAGPHTQSYCRHSEFEVSLLDYATTVGAGTDTVAANRRAMLNLVQVPAAEVYVVTTDSICELAARAHATRTGRDTVPVDLVRVGATRYMLIGSEITQRGIVFFIYDQNFVYLMDFGS